MLTLTGPGGIGKTRLALHLAADLDSDFADGARFVSLEAIRDPDLVASAIARAIDVKPTGGASMRDAMIAVLRHAEILLVVDNVEHVLAAGSFLADLLAQCPNLRILAVSRVLLRVTGEHALAIPPLGLPNQSHPISLEAAARTPAIQLFVERARAIDGAFALTEQNVNMVAEICRRLEGLPLAIELVAPRVRYLALTDLRDRLDRRLPLLTGGSRNHPTRLQTMRNAIAWSHDLLGPSEQELFRHLAVFTGGFTLAAAERLAIHAGSPVVDGLRELVDASLLQVDESVDERHRFRMLETIREFARERLDVSGEAEAVFGAYAEYYLDLAERNAYAGLMPDGVRVLAMLEEEHANLRTALHWFSDVGDAHRLLRLSAAMGWFWSDFGHLREAQTWLEHALDVASEETPGVEQAKAMVQLGMILIYAGMDDAAETWLAIGLEASRAQGVPFTAGLALVGLSGLATLRRDFDRGAKLLEECLVVAPTIGDPRLARIVTGWAWLNLAVVSRGLGDLDCVGQRLELALQCMRDAQYPIGETMVLGDLGDHARDGGDLSRALASYRDALRLGQNSPSTRMNADAIEGIGIVAVIVGQLERGARLLGAADSLRERLGLRYRVTENTMAVQEAGIAVRTELGEDAFAAAWSSGRAMTSAQALITAYEPFPPVLAATSLTPREREVFQFVAAGETDAAIAARLFLSIRTVENHVAHILTKLGVGTRRDAGRLAGVPPSVDDRT